MPDKDELIQGTLDWCNSIRNEQGMKPLTQLPKGQRYNTTSCPCGAATGLMVGARIAFDTLGGKIELPDVVREFVVHFDAGSIPELEDKVLTYRGIVY